jgi:hypothetical protein
MIAKARIITASATLAGVLAWGAGPALAASTVAIPNNPVSLQGGIITASGSNGNVTVSGQWKIVGISGTMQFSKSGNVINESKNFTFNTSQFHMDFPAMTINTGLSSPTSVAVRFIDSQGIALSGLIPAGTIASGGGAVNATVTLPAQLSMTATSKSCGGRAAFYLFHENIKFSRGITVQLVFSDSNGNTSTRNIAVVNSGATIRTFDVAMFSSVTGNPRVTAKFTLPNYSVMTVNVGTCKGISQ